LLDVDILTDMVEDCFRFGIAPRGFVWCERGDGNTFLLSCARWGDLGYIKLSRRGDETLMIISSIPQPTGAELSDAKMGWFRQHFHYGKQKHRAEVIRWLFDGLDRDPIWQQHSATIDAPPKLGRSTNEGPLSLPPKPDPPGRPRFEADEWARTQYHENSETLDDIIQPWLEKVKDEIPDRRFQNPRKSLRGILKRTPKSIDGKTVKQ